MIHYAKLTEFGVINNPFIITSDLPSAFTLWHSRKAQYRIVKVDDVDKKHM